MKKEIFIKKKWSLYIDGWFHHSLIEFLPNGKINNNGTEGFYRWKINNSILELYDERNKLCYSLKYIKSANLLINTAEHRIKNNNIFLAPEYTEEELEQFFQNDNFSKLIANKSALYKSSTGEIWGQGIFFGINGEIYNYHNPNEKYWKVEDGCLKIYNENQELILEQETVSYTNTHQKSIKQISLNFLFGKDKHYLDFLRIKDTSRTVKPLNFLNIDACFSNRSDTLLVIFNSAGGEYNGQTVFHEFYHTPYQFAVDYIRISQSKPTRVYLDSYQKIEALVNINNYKKIVFLGMSSGGYAALWFAETIARKNPLTDYCSIAIQPLTSLKQDFADQMRMRFSDGDRAKTLTNEIINEYIAQGLELDLSEYLKEHINNVCHYVVYDALNEAEAISSMKIISNRTTLTGFDYGLNHSEGCIRIYDSGFLEMLLKKVLITSYQ